MAEGLNDLKKDYRPRFCHGGGTKIDLRQSQNVVKLIQDCFESYSRDVAMNTPSCSTFNLENEERTSMQSQRPKPESASSVKRTSKSPDISPVSPLKPVSSRGHACESHVKSATDDYVATAEKTESSASKSEENSTIKDVEARCQCRDVLLGSKDNRGSARSPSSVEEVKSSPVVKLCFDNWRMPAAAESHEEVKNLEGPQPGRDEQVLPVQGTERVTASSTRTEKPFSSAVLAAVPTRTLGQRYSSSVSPPSPCPVKHQDTEIEDECEFLIDESSDASSTSWITIPTKKKKSKSDGSAIPISKSQPSEKEKTQDKKVKNRKVQVKALAKQKLDHLDVGTSDLKEMSESDPIPNSEENVFTSQSRKSTHTGKTKKDALRQDSSNQKKKTSWRPQAEELRLSRSGLETKPSDEEQCKTRMLPSEDLPMPSSGHQEEQTVSLKKSLRSSKNLQLTSEASQDLGKKKQTAEQKLSKVEEAKRGTVNPRKKPGKSVQQSSSKKPQLQREESSDSESGEEELEREPEVCTTSLDQKLETPVTQKLTKSSVKKKQTAEQELPKVEVAKRRTVNPRKKPGKSVQQSSSKKPQLQREESSDSESGEEELEREPEVCTTSLDQKLETPVTQKLTKSSVKKKQTAEQELPKVGVAKGGTVNPRKKPGKSVQQSSSKKLQLQREESSDSESGEEELEREPEVCTTSLDQKLETPVTQKLTKSSVKKKQTAEQELPKVGVAKGGTVNPRKKPGKSVQQSSSKKLQLQREESSDSESGEEELEREPEVCTTSLDQKLETPVTQKLTKSSVKKKQTAEQELPKVEVAKRGTVNPRKKPGKSVQQSRSKKLQLQREESSDSESGEEEREREPEVCTTSLDQKLETPVTQKLTKSKKPRNVLHTPESPGGANNRTALKALQHPMESVKNPEKKRLSAEFSGKIPNKIPRRTNRALSSSSEDTESETDSSSSSVQDVARKRPKLPDVKIKSNKRKRDRQRGPHGPVLEDSDLFTSSTESSEQDDTSSDSSEELKYKLRRLLSDELTRHKIVMPSNTPNVRRTKRIRLRPLEYWRGERVNYTMDPSGGLVVSGVVHPEKESLRTSKKSKKDHPEEKTDTTNRREIPASLDHSLADVSRPAIVRDPVTNKEVLLDCISTASCVSCHRSDEAADVYKDLSTSYFATGVLVLKPLKVKGRQFVYTNTIAFRILHGEVIVTIHKTSYYLATGDSFYVPAGNEYDIRNLLNEPSVFVFTQFRER